MERSRPRREATDAPHRTGAAGWLATGRAGPAGTAHLPVALDGPAVNRPHSNRAGAATAHGHGPGGAYAPPGPYGPQRGRVLSGGAPAAVSGAAGVGPSLRSVQRPRR